MNNSVVILLAWVQLGTAIALFGMTLWLLHDAHLDWMVAGNREDSDPTIYADALGKIRIAWLRFIEASLLCLIGFMMIWYGAASATVVGRLAVLILTWVQLLKLTVDRLTRMSVLVSAVAPSKAIEDTMRQACDEIREMHRELRMMRREFVEFVEKGSRRNVRS